jgi:Protein of unknown function (DUF2924)
MRKARRELQPAGARSLEAMEAELTRIGGLCLDELRVLWRALTQLNAPKALSRDLMARLIAYRIQEQALGKLSRETGRLLDRLARGEAKPARHLKVGTVMVREHQGRLHEVMVVPGGFSWPPSPWQRMRCRAGLFEMVSRSRYRQDCCWPLSALSHFASLVRCRRQSRQSLVTGALLSLTHCGHGENRHSITSLTSVRSVAGTWRPST